MRIPRDNVEMIEMLDHPYTEIISQDMNETVNTRHSCSVLTFLCTFLISILAFIGFIMMCSSLAQMKHHLPNTCSFELWDQTVTMLIVRVLFMGFQCVICCGINGFIVYSFIFTLFITNATITVRALDNFRCNVAIYGRDTDPFLLAGGTLTIVTDLAAVIFRPWSTRAVEPSECE